MELILGASISPDSVYEGGDVYFDCRIQSRPPPKKIIWQFDVSLSFVRSLAHSFNPIVAVWRKYGSAKKGDATKL